MQRIVWFENWQEMLEQTTDMLYLAAGQCVPGTPEHETMLEEIDRLRQMKRNVRDMAPEERQNVDSFLIPRSTRFVLSIPSHVTQQVGELHDLYRRFRTKLAWIDEAKSSSS